MSQLILNIPQSIPAHLRGVASSLEHSSCQRPWVPAQNPTQVEHLLNQNFCSLYDIPIISLSSREAHRRQELGLPAHGRPHTEVFNEGKGTIIWARPTCMDAWNTHTLITDKNLWVQNLSSFLGRQLVSPNK